MKLTKRTLLLLSFLVTAFTVDTVWAQATGDMIAGQPSPWRHAHFVVIAYGTVWTGIALYVWHLGTLARRLASEVDALSRLTSEEGS